MKMHLNDFGDGFVVDGYGDDFIKIGGARYECAVLLTTTAVSELSLPAPTTLCANDLRPIVAATDADVFLLGAGKIAPPPNPEWFAPFAEKGIALEIMSLPAACRTYNILRGDGRNPAAILII